MTKVVESKIVIRGEDQATPKLEKVEASLLKVTDSLIQISKIPFLDPTKFERVGQALRVTFRDLERFMKMRPPAGRHPLMLPGPAGRGGVPVTRLGGGVEYIPPTMGVGSAGRGGVPVTRLGGGVEYIPPTMGVGFDAVPVRVVNWPAGFGGQAGLRGGIGGGLPVPKQPQPPQLPEPSWFGKFKQLFSAIFTARNIQTAIQAPAGGGLQTIATGAMAANVGGGILKGIFGGMIGRLALGVGGPLAAFGGLAALGMKLAGPAHEYLQQAGRYYYTIGAERLRRGRAYGAGFGYMPMETVGYMAQLARVGAVAAWEPMAGARYAGLEAATAMPYIEAITRAGGAGARTKADYEKIYKELAAAIADKTKLPSIYQLMEQLVGLTGISEQRLADIDEGTRQSLVALSKWGEEGPTAMLRGGRGAATWGKVAGWIAGAKEPAQQVLLYQILSRDPDFRRMLSAKRPDVFGRIPGVGAMPWYQFQLARELPEAWMPSLKGLMKAVPNRWQAMRVLTAGTGMSNWEAMTLMDTVQKHGFKLKESEDAIKKKTGKTFQELFQGTEKSQLDWRDKMARKADKQIEIGEKMGANAAHIDEVVTRLFYAISPLVEGPLATIAHPGEALKATWELGPFGLGHTFRRIFGRGQGQSPKKYK